MSTQSDEYVLGQEIATLRQLDGLPVGAKVRRSYGANITVDRKADDGWVVEEPDYLAERSGGSFQAWLVMSGGAQVTLIHLPHNQGDRA